MHKSSALNAKKAISQIESELPESPVVLDVGGRDAGKQDRSYRRFMPFAGEYFIADINEGANVTHLMEEEYVLPFEEGSIDLIISGQTLEHVKNPFRLVAEMKRVLKDNAMMILIAPSEGRNHDEIDCWRFMRDSFRAIAEECDLVVVDDWIYSGHSGRRDNQWNDHVAILRKP